MSTAGRPSASGTHLRCGFIEDAAVFLDRAEDICDPIGSTPTPASASLSGLFETARDAWMAAVAANKLKEEDWDGDSEAAGDEETGTTATPPAATRRSDDGGERCPRQHASGRSTALPKPRRRIVDVDKFGRETRNERPRRAPKAGAAPLSIEQLRADFGAELRVAVGLAAHMDAGTDLPSVAPRCVSGSRVLVFVEQFDPVCVWSASSDGALLTFCSCGGVLGSGRRSFTGEKIEHVNMQVACVKSSTCRHALALQLAYDDLAYENEADNVDELVSLFPDLAGDDDDKEAEEEQDTAVHLALYAGKKSNVPVFAVFYDHIWSPAIVRRQGNKHKLATCYLLSCSSRPWGCIHAQAVNEYNRLEAAAASAAAADFNDALQFGPDGAFNDDEEDGDEQDPSGPGPPAPPAAPVPPTPLPKRLRRARNMFPCVNEVVQCDKYAAVIDSCRAEGAPKVLNMTHAEPKCLVCDTAREAHTPVDSEEVELYSIRGRLKIYIGSWECPSCRSVVEYDGSPNGLFVATRYTVYVRTFLDAVLELCVIARSTMAAASEFLTSLLRNTLAYSEMEPGQARQLLSDACGEFSSTLVIPETAFRCHSCGAEERVGGRFRCVICDGQVLSVLQEHVVEMLRPGMNAPRVDFSLVFACAIRSAKVRRVVRKRVRANAEDDTALTSAEATAWRVFSVARLGSPPTGGRDVIAARTRAQKAAALEWASSVLFCNFWEVVHHSERQAVPAVVPAVVPEVAAVAPGAALGEPAEEVPADAVAAANDGSSANDNENDQESSDESLVDLVAASGSPDARAAAVGSGDGEMVGEMHQLSIGRAGPGADADVRADGGASADADGPADARAPADAHAPTDADVRSDANARAGADAPADSNGPADADAPVNVGASAAVDTPSSSGTVPVIPLRLTPVNDVPLRSRTIAEATDAPVVNGEYARVELLTDSVPRTADGWKMPRSAVAVSSMPGADKAVVCNSADPLSPLTPRAMAVTAPIKRCRRSSGITAAPRSQEPLVTIDNIALRLWDMQRIAPGVFLQDEVINAYASLLERREAAWAVAEQRPVRIHFFNTFMFEKLVMGDERTYNYEAVCRWSRDLQFKNYDAVFVPINLGIHWVLGIVYPKRRVVETYDSLGSVPDWVVACLVSWIKDDMTAHGHCRGKWTWTKMNCRMQENGTDCGVFMVKTMDYMSRGLPQASMTGDMNYYRRRMAAELFAQTLV